MRDGTPIPLRPKTYAVLRYLAERPGALVTKRELLDAVWGGAAVSEDVVRLSAGEVREALGDDRTAPPLHRNGAAPRLPLHREHGRRRGAYVRAHGGTSDRRRLRGGRRRRRSRARAQRDRRVAARGCQRPAADRIRHRRGRNWQDDAGRHRVARSDARLGSAARCRARPVHGALRCRRALPSGVGRFGRLVPWPRRAEGRGDPARSRAGMASPHHESRGSRTGRTHGHGTSLT